MVNAHFNTIGSDMVSDVNYANYTQGLFGDEMMSIMDQNTITNMYSAEIT